VFYITFPLTCSLVVILATVNALSYVGMNLLEKWEEWAMDYKHKYQGLTYKGNGIWASRKK